MFTCRWFSPQEVAMAIGINLSFMKVVRVVNDNTEAAIYNLHHNVATPFWIGTAVCMFSVVVAMVLMKIDVDTEKEMDEKKKEDDEDHTEPISSYVRRFPVEYWLICIICLLSYSALYPFYNNLSKFYEL